MKAYEVMKALSEGKKVVSKLGLSSFKYIQLAENKISLQVIGFNNEVLREYKRIPVQDLFLGNDWSIYDEKVGDK